MRWLIIAVMALLAGLLDASALYEGIVGVVIGRPPMMFAGGTRDASLAWMELIIAGAIMGGAVLALVGAIVDPDSRRFSSLSVMGGWVIGVVGLLAFVSEMVAYLFTGPFIVLTAGIILAVALSSRGLPQADTTTAR